MTAAPFGTPSRAPSVGGARVAVHLAGALVDLFPGAPRRLELEVGTVRDMVDELNRRWPGMRDRLCDTTPAIRRHINIFVDGERASLEAAIPVGAQVFILTAISGG